jgi:hypothetical protein
LRTRDPPICRAVGDDCHLDDWGRRVFAHTSPVCIAGGGEWRLERPFAEALRALEERDSR